MPTLRILVVDDEAGMRHSILRALRGHALRLPEVGGDVEFALDAVSSGEEALERVAQQPPDIMLLDQQLGGLTGIDVLGRLAGQERELLTIMITAFATIETAVRATKSGAFDFLAKPFTPDELKEALRKAAAHLLVQREARRLAAEKRRVRFEFISVLAHELKSPLGVVEMYLSILKTRPSGSDLNAYEETITRCQARIEGMRKLIGDLLDLTRIESGERRRELQTLDLVELARAAVEAASPAANERQITVNLDAAGPLELCADRGELEIVLNNLLSNAIKYNRDGGRVDLRLRGDEAYATIEAADTGIGLSPEDTARLFNDFVRIRNDQTRAIPGSGLGLSIVRKIAELYDGRVAARGEPGVGSTFTVVFRRQSSPAEPSGGSQRDFELVG